jgi:hypothetical protein
MEVGVSLALRLTSSPSIKFLWASGHRSTGSVFLNQCDVTVGWVGVWVSETSTSWKKQKLSFCYDENKLLVKLPLGLQVQKLSITGLRGGYIPVLPTGIPGLSPTDVPDNNPSGDLIPNKPGFRGFEVVMKRFIFWYIIRVFCWRTTDVSGENYPS